MSYTDVQRTPLIRAGAVSPITRFYATATGAIWAQVTATTTEDLLVVSISPQGVPNLGLVNIEFGTGAAGAEVTQGIVSGAFISSGAYYVMPDTPLPIPVLVPAGTRCAIRATQPGGSAATVDFAVTAYSVSALIYGL